MFEVAAKPDRRRQQPAADFAQLLAPKVVLFGPVSDPAPHARQCIAVDVFDRSGGTRRRSAVLHNDPD